MNYLDLNEVLTLHAALIRASGGSPGLLDRGALESALAQPRMTFGGAELYPTLIEKAAALAYSLALNHAFVDGNKRIAQAAMEALLLRNGQEVAATVDEQEGIFLNLAAGQLGRDEFTDWLARHIVPRSLP
jgi:death-on-curing protein